MKIAILESIIMPAGHEVEFDRIIIDELKRQGHEPVFFVPEEFTFKLDYGVAVEYLAGGPVVTYAGAPKWKKPFLSLLREKRRRAWFNDAYKKLVAGAYDALIIPTATYRYIKAILGSDLKDSPVPVHVIFHGIGAGESARFHKQANKVLPYKNIHLNVITLRDDVARPDLPNVHTQVPPVFLPHVDPSTVEAANPEGITLGFFGQFRKEKQIGRFLDAFVGATFSCPVHLLVQGATAKPEDSQLFEQMIADYGHYETISFMHKNLIASQWDRALLSVDALMLPYGAERYRYHWAAMLYTAIGFRKPVLISPEINPEVLQAYKVGKTIDLSSVETIRRDMEAFVEDLFTHKEVYDQELEKANRLYGHEVFIHNLLGTAE